MKNTTLLLLSVSFLSACSCPTSSITLLPDSYGKVGKIEVMLEGQDKTYSIDTAYNTLASTVTTTTLTQNSANKLNRYNSDILGTELLFEGKKEVFFDTNSFALKSRENKNIEEILNYNNKHPELDILIIGLADARGNARNNLTLSQNRAEQVHAELIARGISKDKIATKFFGDTNTRVSKGTAEELAHDRRVEVIFYTQP